MDGFKSQQTLEIEAAIQAETVRAVKDQTNEMWRDLERAEAKADLERRRQACIQSLLTVERLPDVSPKLKAAVARLGTIVLSGKATPQTRRELKELEYLMRKFL